MTSKPWKSLPGGIQLEAYVGAFGIRTSAYHTTEELIGAAANLFELEPGATCEEMAAAITAIGKKARSERARRNRPSMLPASPTGQETITQGGLEKMMAESTERLVDGHPFGVDGQLDIDPAKLLRKVVSAVISSGHGDILAEFPEVLAFFGARNPAPDELLGHHKSASE